MTQHTTAAPLTGRAIWFRIMTDTSYPANLPIPKQVSIDESSHTVWLTFLTEADAAPWEAITRPLNPDRPGHRWGRRDDGWNWVTYVPGPPKPEAIVQPLVWVCRFCAATITGPGPWLDTVGSWFCEPGKPQAHQPIGPGTPAVVQPDAASTVDDLPGDRSPTMLPDHSSTDTCPAAIVSDDRPVVVCGNPNCRYEACVRARARQAERSMW